MSKLLVLPCLSKLGYLPRSLVLSGTNGFKGWNQHTIPMLSTKTTLWSSPQIRPYSSDSRSASDGSPPDDEGSKKDSNATAGVPHFRRSSVLHPLSEQVKMIMNNRPYTLPHPIWSQEELKSVETTHVPPGSFVDKAAYFSVQTLRTLFDLFSGYSWGKLWGTLDERRWLTRIIYLETVAGVPGMIAAMVRHLRSLRKMNRDYGWIHTLLEEAENERMHLMTALVLKKPGPIFKLAVIGTQGFFVSMFWILYFISPQFCHRFVGYLEEEAVRTYTHCLECIDNGDLKMWAQMAAPEIAKDYWKMGDNAMMRDVILAIRADEAHHRLVNHTLSTMDPDNPNPFGPGR